MHTNSNPGPKDAAIPAAINALINGAIFYGGHRQYDAVPLTVDAISSTEATVGSEAVMLALALAVILTGITAAVFWRSAVRRDPAMAARRPPLPRVLGIAIENALMLFGATVVVAVLWQRTAGTVMVSPISAALLVALIAAAVTVVVDVRTKRALLRHP